MHIPRTRFAVALEISSEQLASYEYGRVPLPYRVFRRLSKQFKLDPLWLATGRSHPVTAEIEDAHFRKAIGRQARFSEVFDQFIREDALAKTAAANRAGAELVALYKRVMQIPAEEYSEALLAQLSEASEELSVYLRKLNRERDEVEARLDRRSQKRSIGDRKK